MKMVEKTPDICAVNMSEGLALLDNDEVIRITDVFEVDGERVSMVCGPDVNGKWYAIRAADYESLPLQ